MEDLTPFLHGDDAPLPKNWSRSIERGWNVEDLTPFLPEGGLRERSYAMPEQLRALSHERIVNQLGSLRPATLAELLRRCRLLLTESR